MNKQAISRLILAELSKYAINGNMLVKVNGHVAAYISECMQIENECAVKLVNSFNASLMTNPFSLVGVMHCTTRLNALRESIFADTALAEVDPYPKGSDDALAILKAYSVWHLFTYRMGLADYNIRNPAYVKMVDLCESIDKKAFSVVSLGQLISYLTQDASVPVLQALDAVAATGPTSEFEGLNYNSTVSLFTSHINVEAVMFNTLLLALLGTTELYEYVDPELLVKMFADVNSSNDTQSLHSRKEESALARLKKTFTQARNPILSAKADRYRINSLPVRTDCGGNVDVTILSASTYSRQDITGKVTLTGQVDIDDPNVRIEEGAYVRIDHENTLNEEEGIKSVESNIIFAYGGYFLKLWAGKRIAHIARVIPEMKLHVGLNGKFTLETIDNTPLSELLGGPYGVKLLHDGKVIEATQRAFREQIINGSFDLEHLSVWQEKALLLVEGRQGTLIYSARGVREDTFPAVLFSPLG